MQLLPLQDVASQIKAGLPLAWSIRDANGKLLLARGQRVTDAGMLEALLARGMFVDAAEMRAAMSSSHAGCKPKEGFLGRWRLAGARLNTLLTTTPAELRAALMEVVDVVIALADRYPDKVLFQILRHDQTKLQSYGVSHSLHSAAVCCLSARRVGWDDAQRRTLVAAALSMNLSMVELQGRLAVQSVPPTPEQRAAIEDHPLRSAELLRAAGVDDPLWLAAIEQHHERADGSGYPRGLTDVGELAQALHFADVFTDSAGHPLAAALIKEFGIYPPGCFVRLASGEIAIVVHRGETVAAPVVACLTNAAGQSMMRPQRRETTGKSGAIRALLADADVMVRVSWEMLYPDD